MCFVLPKYLLLHSGTLLWAAYKLTAVSLRHSKLQRGIPQELSKILHNPKNDRKSTQMCKQVQQTPTPTPTHPPNPPPISISYITFHHTVQTHTHTSTHHETLHSSIHIHPPPRIDQRLPRPSAQCCTKSEATTPTAHELIRSILSSGKE